MDHQERAAPLPEVGQKPRCSRIYRAVQRGFEAGDIGRIASAIPFELIGNKDDLVEQRSA